MEMKRGMKMKPGMMIFSAAALTFAMAGPVMAQMSMHHAAANADRGYFDSHPDVSRELKRDPSLVDNQQFVDSHPGLHEYLRDHPAVRHDFKSHPYRFMRRERAYHRHHG